MIRISWCFFVTVWLLMTFASSVSADDEDSEKAKSLFVQGVEYYEAERYEEALEAFEEVNRLRPSWKLYYNIGQCRTVLKRYGRAVDAFEKYLAKGGDEVSGSRRDEILQELRRLKELVGNMEVKAPAGAILIVDGEERGQAPFPGKIRLSVGITHRVVVKVGEEILVEREVRVGGGESIVVEVTTGGEDDIEEEKNAGEPEVPQSKVLPVLAGVTAGLAVVAGGLATGFWVAAGKRSEDFQDRNKMLANGEIADDDAKLIDARDDTERYDNLTTGMIVATGVFAATAATLLIVHMVKKNKKEEGDVAILPGRIAVRF